VTAPGSEISSLLDNLVMLRHVEISSRFKRTVSVLKVRDRAYEPVIHEVGFGSNGMLIQQPLEPVSGAATGVAAPVEREH